MHGMNWGGHPHRRYKAAGLEVDLPLVSVPVAGIAMLVGLMFGMLLGYKKARVVQMHRQMMGGMGYGMGHGMGHGMMGGMECCGGGWMGRKRAMMQAMAMHHHHGYGSSPCCCGDEYEYDEMPEDEAEGDEERPDE